MFGLFIFLVMMIGIDEFYRMNTNERQTPVKVIGYILTGLMAAYYFLASGDHVIRGIIVVGLFYHYFSIHRNGSG